MYRDPSEFRKRFKAYKDGKSVREIYGLPGYEDGTVQYEKDGVQYNINPNVVGAELINVTTPEITVTGRDLTKPYDSAYLFNDKTLNEAIRKRMYNTITPVGYDIGLSFYDFITGANRRTYDPFREALWAKYLGLDYYRNTDGSLAEVAKAIIPSDYKMKVGNPTYGLIYTLNPDLFKYAPMSNPLHPENIKTIDSRMDKEGKNFVQNVTDAYKDDMYNVYASGLGTFTYGRGKDDIGKYMTFYDDWDLNFLEGGIKKLNLPESVMKYVRGDMLAPFGIGHPFTLADKAYYKNGKLPCHLDGLTPEQKRIQDLIVQNQGTIQQGHRWSPLSNYANSTWRDYNKPFFLLFIEGGFGNVARGLLLLFESWNKEVRGIGDLTDHTNVLLDLLTGAGGKITKNSAKKLTNDIKKVTKNTIKPTKTSVKKNLNPYYLGEYHTLHPEEITRIKDSNELKQTVDFVNQHIAPMYKKSNKILIGLNPEDINLGYADFNNVDLAAYAGPNNRVVLNKKIINNNKYVSDVLDHEVAGHIVDNNWPLTPSQMSEVQLAIPFDQLFLEENKFFPAGNEANAMRRLFLRLISKNNGNVVGSELNKVYKNMPRALKKRYWSQIGYSDKTNINWDDLTQFDKVVTSIPAITAFAIPTTHIGIDTDRNFLAYGNGKLPGYEDGEISMGAKRNLTEEELNTALLNILHEQGMSGEDPVLSTLVGMKALRLVGDLLSSRRLRQKAELYKRIREANDQTRNASRAWKILDADKYARDWGMSNNPAGFLYDIFLDPLANLYTKILKHPVLGPLIPFKDGKLPGYSNGKIRIKPANRGKFNATKKRTGKTTEELTHSKNPLTRKRAIFALNAKKWNHK